MVKQSGTITPGHSAVWVTDGVVQDGGPIAASLKVLGSARSANFNTNTDQPILITPGIAAFAIAAIIVTNASVSINAAAGGFYTATFKGGSAIVSAAQTYAALTGPNLIMNPTLTGFAGSARFSSSNLPFVLGPAGQYLLAVYLSLTTPQGVPCTADVYLTGIDLT